VSPYATEESSVESGRPIELYEFAIEGGNTYRYTSAADDITAMSQLWTARPAIQRGRTTLGVENRESENVVTLPGDDQFALNFVPGAPSGAVTLVVRRLHAGDVTDIRRIYEGEVVEIEWVDQATIARVVCRPTEGASDAKMPRFDSGGLCPHMLYDSYCTVAEASFQYAGTVSSPSGDQITVSGLTASKGNGWATAGKVLCNGELRVVLLQSSDVLTLGSPFNQDPTGQAVTVSAGCDHTIATCDTKFGNEVNFGGSPHVPKNDPQRRF